jgi:hypothetical protein
MASKREAAIWCRRTYKGHRRMFKACIIGVKAAASGGNFYDAASDCNKRGLTTVELAACTVGAGRVIPKGSRMGSRR